MKKLENKVAIVTGATSGMGLETAKLFLKEGAKVVLTGRNQEKLDALKSELEGEYLLVKAEASSITDSAQLIKTTVETFGKIDTLFLNAGIFRIETIDGLTEEIYDEVHNINVRGPLFTVKAAYNHLNEGASIIFNTSIVNVKGFAGMAAYGASKAAVIALSDSLRLEVKGTDLQVSCVSPGDISTNSIATQYRQPTGEVDHHYRARYQRADDAMAGWTRW